jgi:hypothetical protein
VGKGVAQLDLIHGGGMPKRVGGQIREVSSLCLCLGPSKYISLAHGRVKQEDRYGLQDNLLLRFVRKIAGAWQGGDLNILY